MIQSINITGVKYTIDTITLKYATRKFAGLDRYMPSHARASATADVRLKLVNRDHGNKYEAEVVLTLPNKRLTAKDSTVNMLAAIDIVEAKLRNQLRAYKRTAKRLV